MITQQTNISLVPGGVPPVLHVSQFDTGTRTLVFTITDASVDYTGMTVRIEGIKPDGKGFSYADGDETDIGTFSITRSGNVITSDCVRQMTAVKGCVRCSLIFYHEDESRIETTDFVLMVKEAVLANDEVISDTELPAIIALAKEQQEAAEGSSLDAEAWATGKRGGVDVPATDETYHNNAMFYAGEADQSADNAASSETNAKNSEDAAALSETNAAQSEENAEAWATGKRGGVDVPATDETYHNNAEYYAGKAGESEDAAKASELNAEAWANGTRNGDPIINTDPAYQKNSKYWSELAGIYADYVAPHFIIQNNRLYLRDDSTPVFAVANNRLYIRSAAA